MEGDTAIHEEVARHRHGRVPRGLRERQLLAVAEELFAERGYEHTSMGDVAARAGVTKPVVYAIFSSKEELFARCFDRAGEELLTAVSTAAQEAGASDVESVLRASTLAFLRFLDEHRRAWAMLYALDAGGRTAVELQKIRARQNAWAASVLAAASRLPEDDERITLVAAALNAGAEAVAHWRREHPDVPVEQATEWFAELVLPGLRALVGPSSP